MNDLLSSTLGAVGQVGDAIDKFTGGRALRGTLAGKPRELASVIPFSDSLGLTDEHDKTSGRDLTDVYGITSMGDNSFGSHAAGFLADNVLSPGNMLGAYGAFKAAPTVAKGLTQGAKALSGLDLLDHVSGAARGLANKVRGVSDPMAEYAKLTKNFPQQVPLETYRTPQHILDAHIGAMPDQGVLGMERRNNDRISQYLGTDQRATAGHDAFRNPTTTPVNGSGTEGAGFAQRFSNPVPSPHYNPTAPVLPSSREDLDAQLAAIGWGQPEKLGDMGLLKGLGLSLLGTLGVGAANQLQEV